MLLALTKYFFLTIISLFKKKRKKKTILHFATILVGLLFQGYRFTMIIVHCENDIFKDTVPSGINCTFNRNVPDLFI